MGLEDVLARIKKMFRAFEPIQPSGASSAYRRPALSRLDSDEEYISFIRENQDKEDLAIQAIHRIKNKLRVSTLAIDPDLQPYIRIAALSRLDSTCDDLRILIARSDRDPGVCVVAIQTLHRKSRATEARDSVHDVVRLFINQPAIE